MARTSVSDKARFTHDQLAEVERATEERAIAEARGKRTKKSTPLDIDKDVDIGLSGLVQILMRRTYKNAADLGDLSDVELVTTRNQARNVTSGYLSGLRSLGELVCSYDRKVGGDIDTNGLGWLVQQLTEGVEIMQDIEESAELELERRGYDLMGVPLSITASA